MPPDLIAEQIDAVLEDVPPAAAKTGALGNAAAIEAVARAARQFRFPLVVDPVMISKHGAPLIEEAARETLRLRLLPAASLITPNLHEAAALTGLPAADLPGMRAAALRLHEQTGASVLVKGGHLESSPCDLLLCEGVFHEFHGERHNTPHTHGTGCTYSAAITANLALGYSLVSAVARAKRFIAEAIRTAPGIGGGQGPVNHFTPVSE
jgi:hydroxymethylpyrimidine/phosphomethylpyrimidine kinase